MKKAISALLSVFLCLAISISSCEKADISAVTANPPTSPGSDSTVAVAIQKKAPFPELATLGCEYTPSYGDSVLYQQPTTGQDYLVAPTTSGQSGTYFSWPDGLVMNSSTGIINVTQSQNGLRYNIGFVKTSTTDTCLGLLIIAGTSYIDSIYATDQADTLAAPYFNANPAITSVCGSGNGCHFDLSGKGASKGLKIDTKTGVIELTKTKKVFGPHPYNGQTVPITILYSLNDDSHNAVQSLTFDLIYYDLKANVPTTLSTLITQRRANTYADMLISKTSAPRPPLIVITRAQ